MDALGKMGRKLGNSDKEDNWYYNKWREFINNSNNLAQAAEEYKIIFVPLFHKTPGNAYIATELMLPIRVF